MFRGVYTIEIALAAAFMSPPPWFGPFSCTMYTSMAVIRPSSRNPILMRPWKPGRAEPRKYSSVRLILMSTGFWTLRDMCAGIESSG